MKLDTENLTLNGIEYVRKDSIKNESAPAINTDGLQFVICRCRDAGVHAGYLLRRIEGTREATLIQSRRLWRWHGRTLDGLATEGTDNAQLCKYGPVVDSEKVLCDVAEIINCTEAAMRSVYAVADWKND
jgi:hypothetical protein